MRMFTLTLLGVALVLSGCNNEADKACTPPNSYWQVPHNFVGLMPEMNYVSMTRDGRLHWNGRRVSSAALTQMLRQSHQLNPEPVVFLETEMGAPCEALDAVREQMDEALECKESARCAEGIETVWSEMPSPPGQPIS